jgi:hypothetical protein
MATAAWIAAAAVSTGGMTALVLKKAVSGKAVNHFRVSPKSKEDHHG